MKNREKQFLDFLALAREKETRATMNDHEEKIRKLDEPSDTRLSASQQRGRLLTGNLIKAYNPEETVVWHSLFMPAEIFYAMDMVPYSTEMIAAGIAGAGLGRKLVETGEEYLGCRDSCSFVTCSYGGINRNILPEPDIIVTTSQLCDPEKKLARFASKTYGRKEFYIDVPYGGRTFSGDRYQGAVDYLAGQLREMAAFLQQETGKILDMDRLKQALDYSNQARKWFLKINDLRQGPGLIRGAKALDFSAVLLNIWGTKEAVDIYSSLYHELVRQLESGKTREDQFRIGWIHLRPYYDNTLFDHMENRRGISVVVEEINYIFWDEFDVHSPYQSLAKKILANPAYSPIEQKFAIYQRMLQKYRIDGIIGFAHKGCRHYYSAVHLAMQRMKNIVPMLVIDGDCIDPRAYSFPLLQTRIDSFVEMMESKKPFKSCPPTIPFN